MNIRFNDETEKALKQYLSTSDKNSIRLKILARG